MNTYVFVFYRQAAATVFLAPTAMFFQRRTAPPLSFTIFVRNFFLSLCGITTSLNIFGVALTYTTASSAAATSNTLPVITFFLAVLFRMEKVKLRTSPGIMKVLGVALCLAGAATIALYRGPFLKLLLHHHLIKSHHQQLEGHAIPSPQSWIKGVTLMQLSNITWALWLVLQGRVLKSYPSKFLLLALQCFLSTIQSFLVAVAFVRDPNEWKLGWDVKLVSIAYCGIVVTGIAFYLQTWVIEKKGPVYLAMTTPLTLIFTTAASTFLFGETISLGSVLGGLLLVGGLYFVLWGKTKEEEKSKSCMILVIFGGWRAPLCDGPKTLSKKVVPF
ncbi:unnamed protein product [Fraxinus pennsylvanica]|uniref:WAT1-related protein n=1 Tax=Fraxinus pennsylvanica TaxID=56036 RepID=A0AAD2A4Q1_9LAMI|nr:unnamed protein product [Fraxinus pennsylvanica]